MTRIEVHTRRVEVVHSAPETPANGDAMAAFLSAGIGAFAVGVFVIANEAGLFAAPSLYGPAGGVSGRTTFAVVVWLLSWAVLHSRWKGRVITSRRVFGIGLLLTGLGFLGTLPLVWGLF